MAQRRVKVGVAGCNMGGNHARRYLQLDNAELVAICDIDEPWLKYCQQQWSVPSGYTRYEEMFARPDLEAVSIALPTYLHAQATIAALNAGKHVLVEKPIGVSAAEAESMARAAEQNGRVLMISHNQRFDVDMQFLKRYVEEGSLGDIYFARTIWRRPMGMFPQPIVQRATGTYNRNWFNEADRGGGVARDLGSHIIDLAMWLMGFPEIADVSGRAYSMFAPGSAKQQGFRFDADDHSVGFVRFKNGASLHMEASFGQHIDKEVIMLELFGSKGGAIRLKGESLRLFSSAAGAYTTVEPRLAVTGDASTQKAFIDSILSGRPPAVTVQQAIAVMRVIDQIRS